MLRYTKDQSKRNAKFGYKYTGDLHAKWYPYTKEHAVETAIKEITGEYPIHSKVLATQHLFDRQFNLGTVHMRVKLEHNNTISASWKDEEFTFATVKEFKKAIQEQI